MKQRRSEERIEGEQSADTRLLRQASMDPKDVGMHVEFRGQLLARL